MVSYIIGESQINLKNEYFLSSSEVPITESDHYIEFNKLNMSELKHVDIEDDCPICLCAFN